jgi:hypothetical protein
MAAELAMEGSLASALSIHLDIMQVKIAVGVSAA